MEFLNNPTTFSYCLKVFGLRRFCWSVRNSSRTCSMVTSATRGRSTIFFAILPRTTDRPVRKRGDEPRSNSVVRKRCVPYSARLERGECSDLPVRAAPQSHGCKSVVRGLPLEVIILNGIDWQKEKGKPLACLILYRMKNHRTIKELAELG